MANEVWQKVFRACVAAGSTGKRIPKDKEKISSASLSSDLGKVLLSSSYGDEGGWEGDSVNFPARGRLCGGIQKKVNINETRHSDFSAQLEEVQNCH